MQWHNIDPRHHYQAAYVTWAPGFDAAASSLDLGPEDAARLTDPLARDLATQPLAHRQRRGDPYRRAAVRLADGRTAHVRYRAARQPGGSTRCDIWDLRAGR